MKAILGKKIGMTRTFDKRGNAVPVTVIEATPNVITQIKTQKKDGYEAIQIGFGHAKKLAKPQIGHLKAIKENLKYLREVSVLGKKKVSDEAILEVGSELSDKEGSQGVKVGDKIFVDIFSVGDKVEAIGISKGKGFAGVIKRHNFKRGPMSHGSHHHRSPGSIGSMFPQHVFKGTKLPGRMGSDQVTVKNLKIVLIDKENNLLVIKGAIPGPQKGLVVIRG